MGGAHLRKLMVNQESSWENCMHVIDSYVNPRPQIATSSYVKIGHSELILNPKIALSKIRLWYTVPMLNQ